jgi:hypothetical protein
VREVIEAVRARLSPAPRPIPWRVRWALRCHPPGWMGFRDPLKKFYGRRSRLLKHGTVVWCAVVQANSLLFEPGAGDHPAKVIFSNDPYFDDEPYHLLEIAERLFALKGTTPNDPELLTAAKSVTDEMERKFNVLLPKSLTDGKDVISSETMIVRSHLPFRMIIDRSLPLLIHPSTDQVMLVPHPFLTDDFKK